MTAKQVLIRFMKDNGYYRHVMNKGRLFGNPANSIYLYLGLCIDANDGNYPFSNCSYIRAMSVLSEFSRKFKYGDKIMVCTQDGKYEYEYIFAGLAGDFESFVDDTNNFHKLDRITMINGERVDGKKGFLKYIPKTI